MAAPRDMIEYKITMPNKKEIAFVGYNNTADLMVTERIMVGSTYPIMTCMPEARTIVDVGANIGAATIHFAIHYPQAQVYAFEPSPVNFQVLAHNTKQFPNVSAMEFGLSDSDSAANLYLSATSVCDSLVYRADRVVGSVSVRVRDAMTALRELGVHAIDILKLDTEGCEVQVLKSIRDFIPAIGVLYVEPHDGNDEQIHELLKTTHLRYFEKVAPGERDFVYLSRRIIPSLTPSFAC